MDRSLLAMAWCALLIGLTARYAMSGPPLDGSPSESAQVVAQGSAVPQSPAGQQAAAVSQNHPPATHQGEELIPVPTLGGKQFWGDEHFDHQYRIQRNVFTGQCRLLDNQDQRLAAGSFDECLAILNRFVREQKLKPMRGPAVLVLHGLGRNRACMEPLCDSLRKTTGWWVFNIGYPSTRRPIREHAKVLARILEHLQEIDEIYIVAHSMGNIVVRHYLGDCATPGSARKVDPRIRRMVMLGPPNHGAMLATALAENQVFEVLLGKPGQQLGREWSDLEPHLGMPPFEFGIIAGGLGDDRGFNTILPGDDDGIVSVQTTRLAGAADFLVLPVFHTFLVDNQQAIQYTTNFLRNGCFTTPEQRKPVKAEGP